MWSVIRTIPKFTPRSQADRLLGTPGLPLEDRPVYACGGGFTMTFSPVRFRVEGLPRAEYGEPGEYAVSVLHFSDNAALQTHLGLEHSCPGRAAVLGRRTLWTAPSPTAPPWPRPAAGRRAALPRAGGRPGVWRTANSSSGITFCSTVPTSSSFTEAPHRPLSPDFNMSFGRKTRRARRDPLDSLDISPKSGDNVNGYGRCKSMEVNI